MYMIRHQAVTPNLSLGLSDCLPQQYPIKLVITILKECLRMVITTLCHVMWIVGNYNTR